MWVLVLFRTLGAWGNTIFVIASAWFLCMNDKVKLDKVVKMVLDVFAISATILVVALLVGVRPDAKTIIKCLFPTTFANNWFITCYLLLYAIHPAINWVTDRLGKRGHAALTVALALMYMVLPMAHGGHFFWSELVVMISIYVLTSYVHKHMPRFASSQSANLRLFRVGSIGMIALVILLELAGQHVGALSDKMLHFDVDGDILLVFSCLGLFNLARIRPFVNARVNRISALMLFVYLIHENLIVRTYLRRAVWAWIWSTLGYSLFFLWLFLFAIILFIASLGIALAYTKSLGRLTSRAELPVEKAVRGAGHRTIEWLYDLEQHE